MPNQTLASLLAASSLTGPELFYTVQGGADRKATSSQIYNYVVSVSTFGGSIPSSAPLHQFANQVTSSGALLYQQPAFSDISGIAASSQVGLGPFTVNQVIFASSTTTASGMSGTTWDDVNRSLTFVASGGGTLFQISSAGFIGVGSSVQAGYELYVKSSGATQNADLGFESNGHIADFFLDSLGFWGVFDGVNNFNRLSINAGLSSSPLSVGYLSGFAVSGSTGADASNIRSVFTSPALGTWQSGRADAAAIQAQTFQAQSVVAGTANTVGADWTFIGSKGTGTGAGGNLIFQTAPAGVAGSLQNAAAEGYRLDSGGNITIGGFANTPVQGVNTVLQLVTTSNPWQFGNITIGNSNTAGGWYYAKTRGTVPSSQVILQANDKIIIFEAAGSDGVNYQNAGRIEMWVDAAPAANSMPGRWTFSTTPTGTITPTERMRIDSNGNITNGFATFAMQNTGFFPKALMAQTDGSPTYSGAAFGDPVNTTFGSGVLMAASRNATIGAHTLLQNNDPIGYVQFNGSDGTAFRRASYMESDVDGVAAASNMPGRLRFGTSPFGTINPVERLRIDNTGNTWLMNATVVPATPAGAKANINGIAANYAHASYGGI